MLRSKLALAAIMAVATVAFIGQAMSQDRGYIPGPVGSSDPEEVAKAQQAARVAEETKMKETLGATDDEWKVIQPKFAQLRAILTNTPGGAQSNAMGSPTAVAPGTDISAMLDIQKKLQALRNLLKNNDVKNEDLLNALKDLRDARAKVKEMTAKAQKELKEVLTVKQEAKLVLMGWLE